MFFCAACATPNKSKLLAASLAFSTGAAIGASTAPTDERRDLHAVYWGSLLGLGTALAANYWFSEEDDIQKKQLEIDKLKAQMDLIQNGQAVLLKEGKGYFKNSSGEAYFQSGRAKWRLYQIDKWSKDGTNRLYHQDKMVELLPNDSDQ